MGYACTTSIFLNRLSWPRVSNHSLDHDKTAHLLMVYISLFSGCKNTWKAFSAKTEWKTSLIWTTFLIFGFFFDFDLSSPITRSERNNIWLMATKMNHTLKVKASKATTNTSGRSDTWLWAYTGQEGVFGRQIWKLVKGPWKKGNRHLEKERIESMKKWKNFAVLSLLLYELLLFFCAESKRGSPSVSMTGLGLETGSGFRSLSTPRASLRNIRPKASWFDSNLRYLCSRSSKKSWAPVGLLEDVKEEI